MKILYLLLCSVALCLFSSFATSKACSYATSNMSYVQTQTEKALADNDLNKAKFFTYKAIKSIQASADKFDNCGCDDAEVSISESLTHLKAATHATSLNGSRILLQEALQNIIDVIDALSQHEMHDNALSSKEFTMNTTIDTEHKKIASNVDEIELHKRIDTSLLKYKVSLNTAVDSLNCTDAKAFADRIFQHCEQQLLKTNISEAKKYYNLKTKEITAEALIRMSDCGLSEAK